MKNEEKILKSWQTVRTGGGHSSDPDDAAWSRLWQSSDAIGQDFQPDVEAGLSRLKNRIARDEPSGGRVVAMSGGRRWWRAVAAVGVLLLTAWGVSRFQADNQADFAWQEVRTVTGEVREVMLPDGSTVALNENTVLSYRANLNEAGVRDIRLEGEAFFDVQRRENQPFIIRTAHAEVKVLGTSFKVRELPGEARTAVEVNTGKVAVRHLEETAETVYLTATQAVEVVDGDYKTYTVDEAIFDGNLWSKANPRLNFKNTALETVLLEVEKAYAVDFVWDGKAVRNCPITINWGEESFTNVLEYLRSLGVTVETIDDKTYRLSGSCQ